MLAAARRMLTSLVIVLHLVVAACGGGGQQGSTPVPPPPPPTPSPSPGVIISPSPSPSPSLAGENYTVVEGDTLVLLAERFYGDVNLWRRIFDANRGVMGDNPDNLRAGTVLRIPPRSP